MNIKQGCNDDEAETKWGQNRRYTVHKKGADDTSQTHTLVHQKPYMSGVDALKLAVVSVVIIKDKWRNYVPDGSGSGV